MSMSASAIVSRGASSSGDVAMRERDDVIVCVGTVVAEHRGGMYEVDADIGGAKRKVLARRAGRMVKAWVRVIPGDEVTIEVSAFDLGRGRIVYRGARRGTGAA
jgi:translation initiation factor IF-1